MIKETDKKKSSQNTRNWFMFGYICGGTVIFLMMIFLGVCKQFCS